MSRSRPPRRSGDTLPQLCERVVTEVVYPFGVAEMSTYHDRTLALLGPDECGAAARSVEGLRRWAAAEGISLPTAFVEWAQLGGEAILRKFSNCDGFNFERPVVVVTPEGVRGLMFHEEN